MVTQLMNLGDGLFSRAKLVHSDFVTCSLIAKKRQRGIILTMLGVTLVRTYFNALGSLGQDFAEKRVQLAVWNEKPKAENIGKSEGYWKTVRR